MACLIRKCKPKQSVFVPVILCGPSACCSNLSGWMIVWSMPPSKKALQVFDLGVALLGRWTVRILRGQTCPVCHYCIERSLKALVSQNRVSHGTSRAEHSCAGTEVGLA